MGRNRVVIDENHYLIFGFDAPCNGYFCEYYDKTSEEYQHAAEPSERIGFFRGVNKTPVITMFEKYNAVKLAEKQVPVAWTNLCLDLEC